MAKRKGNKLESATVHEFVRLHGQLKSFYDEISLLSKKSPDGAMNKFKLRFINETLKKTTALLGDEYRPFPEFEVFSDDEMPTTSDVGMMLSQYLNSMGRFKNDHIYKGSDFKWYWRIAGDENIRSDNSPK